jgi:hypothetical protein
LRLFWRLLPAGLLAYLLFLAVGFPAQRGALFLQQQVDGLVLQSVTGTLLSGRAGGVELQGLALGPVSWLFRPASLLRGRLEYRLDFQGPPIQGSIHTGVGLSGDIYGRELDAVLQPDPLVNQFFPLPVQTLGTVRVQAESFRLVDGFPRELSGQADWTAARILDPVNLELGDVVLVLGNEGDALTGSISNKGATGISGDISLTPAHDYRLELNLVPGPDTPLELVDMLADFAEARPGGAYRISDAGRL